MYIHKKSFWSLIPFLKQNLILQCQNFEFYVKLSKIAIGKMSCKGCNFENKIEEIFNTILPIIVV